MYIYCVSCKRMHTTEHSSLLCLVLQCKRVVAKYFFPATFLFFLLSELYSSSIYDRQF